MGTKHQDQHRDTAQQRETRIVRSLADRIGTTIEHHPVDDGRLVICGLLLALGRAIGEHGGCSCAASDWMHATLVGYPLYEIGWQETGIPNHGGDHEPPEGRS